MQNLPCIHNVFDTFLKHVILAVMNHKIKWQGGYRSLQKMFRRHLKSGFFSSNLTWKERNERMNFDNFKEWLLMPSRNFTKLMAGTRDSEATLEQVLKNCFENEWDIWNQYYVKLCVYFPCSFSYKRERGWKFKILIFT